MRKEKIEELESLIDKYKTIEIINERNISSGFLKIIQADYRLKNGVTINRERYLKNNLDGSSVIVMPVNENNEVILVVQPRVNTKRTVTVELPAGLIDEGEIPIEAAKRELLEETGCISNNIISIYEGIYPDPSSSRATTNLYIAMEVKKVKEQSLDDDEFISLFTCTFDEAIELIHLGYIKDIMTILLLEKAKKYLMKN